MDFSVVLLHRNPQYLQKCCDLINSEWKRSDTARFRSLESSCDQLPTSLILLRGNKVLGHVKLSVIPSIPNSCFIESVVIAHNERGKGLGTLLMQKAEDYCRTVLHLDVVYLSTKGQEEFYRKLGYIECMPISIYGSFTPTVQNSFKNNINVERISTNDIKNIPAPPPMPVKNNIISTTKTFMKKDLTNC
ncbi:N-alpha-acetyltransferase 80 [Sitophilus oryzae]|uniref:N-alpha-acetyltransferase 80 n=1 Tax=Sitophilus oryzae TaxID=7048 RepID=A0A6J2XAK0_SITOR|nr:N-alpha-acetyltransferase 80 [Sitophilus oryzae]